MAERREVIAGSLGANARHEAISLRLAADGRLLLSDTADALGVSEMTIRRDLAEMEQAGLIRRVRGGAVALGPQLFERRKQFAGAAKRTIARKLLQLIPDSGAVALDASSTVHRLSTELRSTPLTIVTNGTETFAALSGRPGINAILTGGTLEESTGALVGPTAQRCIEDFVFTRAFVSPTGLDAGRGATEATDAGAALKRAVRAAAQSLVVAVDSTKLGRTAPARVVGLDRIDVLVTELDPSDARLDAFREAVELR